MRKLPTRHTKGVVELVVRIIHLITTEYCLQAAFIEGSIMSHKGQALNQRLYLFPYLRKNGGIVCVFTTEAVNLRTPVVIVVWFRLNEGVEGIHNLSVPDNNYAHRTNRTPLVIGCLKIYCCKISHIFLQR